VTEELPRIAIVVLNYNGRQHLEPCFKSLLELDYPRDRFDLVLVDNGSVDGSLEIIKRAGWVRLIANGANLGFSRGCNQGAEDVEDAEILVFLNNDMRVDPGFLRELIAPITRGEVAATTAKMLSWDGKLINSAGGAMNFHGVGIQKGYMQKPAEEHDVPARTLFACGGAMAIERSVFMDVGGFDEEFFAYYEDVDLGWRLWVMGHEILYVPTSICYHHHSSTSRSFPMESIRLLQVRNPILACFKNYDDENMKRVLPVATGLAMRRMRLVAGIHDERPFRIEHVKTSRTDYLAKLKEKARRRVSDTIPVRREAVADFLGLNDLFGNWDHWMQRRGEVQARRKRSDAEILELFEDPLWCIEKERTYAELHNGMTSFFGVKDLFGK
jgi:GT2 family glycosyltransferase